MRRPATSPLLLRAFSKRARLTRSPPLVRSPRLPPPSPGTIAEGVDVLPLQALLKHWSPLGPPLTPVGEPTSQHHGRPALSLSSFDVDLALLRLLSLPDTSPPSPRLAALSPSSALALGSTIPFTLLDFRRALAVSIISPSTRSPVPSLERRAPSHPSPSSSPPQPVPRATSTDSSLLPAQQASFGCSSCAGRHRRASAPSSARACSSFDPPRASPRPRVLLLNLVLGSPRRPPCSTFATSCCAEPARRTTMLALRSSSSRRVTRAAASSARLARSSFALVRAASTCLHVLSA